MWKVSRDPSYVVFNAYKGNHAAVAAKDVYTDKIIVQGLDSVILPGKKQTATCLAPLI